MSINTERRREQRLRYHWPIWFAEDFNGILNQGQMVDISSTGAAFTFRGENEKPYPGQELTARFSIPRFGPDDSFEMANFVRTGQVCRVEGGIGHSRQQQRHHGRGRGNAGNERRVSCALRSPAAGSHRGLSRRRGRPGDHGPGPRPRSARVTERSEPGP